jgi:microcystin-dependent protein
MANAATIREKGSDGVEFTAAIPASQPGDVFPAGVILHYAGSAAPTGWLVCDGSIISIATYPNLFSALSTLYGGDGITTFGIPDMRGRVPVGKHSSGTFATLGLTGGEENHVLSVSEMPLHNHSGFTGSGTTGGGTTGSTAPSGTTSQPYANDGAGSQHAGSIWGTTGSAALFTNTLTVAAHSHSIPGLSVPALNIPNQGGGATHNNMPPYIVVNHIIRAY